MYIHTCVYMCIYICKRLAQSTTRALMFLVVAFNALKFQCAQRDFLSELLL